MKKYVIEREMPGIGASTPAQLRAGAETSNEALARLAPDVQWVKSYVVRDRTFCIYLARDEALIRQHGAFCVGVIDDASKKLIGHFARGFEPGAPAFAGIDVAVSVLGVPYPTGACAHLVCRVIGAAADWSDHVLFCGQVVDGDGRLDAAPMVHVRKNGLGY